jgi:hypothetical protein
VDESPVGVVELVLDGFAAADAAFAFADVVGAVIEGVNP